MKKYLQAVEVYSSNPSEDQKKAVDATMSAAYSKIDKAVKKGVFHKNNGARKKARLAKALKSAASQSA